MDPLRAFTGMAALLIGWAGCLWLTHDLVTRRRVASDWSLTWALGSVFFGAGVTALVELTSLARAFNRPVLLAAWLGLDALLLLSVARLGRWRGARLADGWTAQWKRCREQAASWPGDAAVLLGVTVFLAVVLGILALAFSTTNWDALSYHLPRILYWIQQGSVEHFATANTRQIEFAPWGSFFLATIYLVGGQDRWLSLGQWGAMISCLVVLPGVARRLSEFGPGKPGDSHAAPDVRAKRVTALTCLFVVTLPIGLVEAMTPQTDYLAAYWLGCLVLFALQLIREPANAWWVLGAGLAAGLGVLTKATTYVYAAPLILVGGAWWVWRLRSGRAVLRLSALFVVAFFALNAGHMLRNQTLFGSPLGSKEILTIERNAPASLSGTLSNLIRNLALHANTGIRPLSRSLIRGLQRAHDFTGRDPNDPATTYPIGPFEFNAYTYFRIYDSEATGFYHLVLIALAATMVVARPRRHRALAVYAGLAVASVLLFCALLRWQQWHIRLHLPYFILLAPWLAVVVADHWARWAQALAACGLTAFAIVCLLTNASRPILDRQFTSLALEDQYLAHHTPRMIQPMRELAECVVASGIRDVGLKFEFDDAEFPLWMLLKNRGFAGTLRHVYVGNESARLARPPPDPELLIVSGTDLAPEIRNRFPVSRTFGYLRLMSRPPVAP